MTRKEFSVINDFKPQTMIDFPLRKLMIHTFRYNFSGFAIVIAATFNKNHGSQRFKINIKNIIFKKNTVFLKLKTRGW